MALIGHDMLNPGVRRRELFAWAMYDFANSGYTTVVITAVFAAYFVGGVAGGAAWAPLAWTAALSVSYAIVMLTMPALGAWADARAAKKPALMAVTAGCVLGTATLAWVQPGSVALAMGLIIVSNTFYSYGESLAASFLPELARPEAMGKVSGWGWAFGYVGGMLTLAACLAYVLHAQGQGRAAAEFVPVTMLITAAVYGLAACATFAWLRERAAAVVPAEPSAGMASALTRLTATFRQARHYPDLLWLLACTVAYQGGVAVAITLAAIYAEQVIGFAPQETMALIMVLNVAAAAGAFAGGYLQDGIGHKRTLAITLVGWVLTCIIAALATNKGQFWVAAVIAGICMGSCQSIGRAMVGLFTPRVHLAAFFGLWSFATRLASIVGPLAYGLITWGTGGNQRVAIACTTLLFVLGLLALRPIDVARGRAEALRTA